MNNNVTSRGDLGRRIQNLRDEAEKALLLSWQVRDQEARASLRKYAEALKSDAEALENRMPRF